MESSHARRRSFARSAPLRRLVLVALLGLSASACAPRDESADPTPPVPFDEDGGMPEPPLLDCDAPGAFSLAEPTEAAILGERVDGTFALYRDSGRAGFEWGFQGGTMITPVVRIPSDLLGAERCVDVHFENLPDPAQSASSLELSEWYPLDGDSRFPVAEDGTTDAIGDPLSWEDPTGLRFLLRATVRGRDFALTETVAVEVFEGEPCSERCPRAPEVDGENPPRGGVELRAPAPAHGWRGFEGQPN